MELWAVVWVTPFRGWPMLLELYEHRTQAAARAAADANDRPDQGDYNACAPIETGVGIPEQLDKMYNKSVAEMERQGVILFPRGKK